MNKLLIITFFIVTTLSEGMATESKIPELKFSKGVYRQEGSCSRVLQNGKSVTYNCLPYIGVWAREHDRPEFMFELASGNSWVFISSGPAVISNKNHVITYPVSEMLDRKSKKFILYKGECVITIGAGKEEIRCTTWKDDKRTTLAWEVIFNGNGTWRHKPSLYPPS